MNFFLNRVQAAGVMVADPVEAYDAQRRPCTAFTIATRFFYTDRRTGERRERIDYLPVAIQNEFLAKMALSHARRGSRVYLEGALQNGRDGKLEIYLGPHKSTFEILSHDCDVPAQGETVEAVAA
jgi:hypothetical protein